MKQRIKWLDIVKCFGIFLIYIGHQGAAAGNTYSFVFTHHVQLFFLLSGCSEAITDEKKLTVTVKKTINGILIPWLFFSLLALTFYTLVQNLTLGGILTQLRYIATGTIRNQYFAGALWFLTCICVVRIAFAVIKKVHFKPVILLICFAMYLCAEYVLEPHPGIKPSWVYNLDSALYYIIYYAIGYILFPFIHKALDPKTVFGRYALLASFLASAAYAALRFFGKDPLSVFSGIPVLKTFLPILKVLLIVWMYFVIARLCENVEIFNQIGKNTLYLCGSEYIAYRILSALRGVFGLSSNVSTPLTAYVYCILILVLATKYLVPIEKKIINWIIDLPRVLAIKSKTKTS